MGGLLAHLEGQLASLAQRIGGLAELPALLDLPAGRDLTARQWQLVRLTVERAHAQLFERHQQLERKLPEATSLSRQRSLAAALGRIELSLTTAYGAFDTMMDVLTQRQGRLLGTWLKGCDVLAASALLRPHPTLRAALPPLVHCDRGYGASILRAGARLAAGLPTRLSLIQLPYSRFEDMLHLTSLFHEVGHEALHRLGLVRVLGPAVARHLRRAGAPRLLLAAVARWTRELGPDVWAFLCSGLAAVCTTRDILALPPAQVFQVSPHDPHPPPWLRVQFGYALCEAAWGSGPWTDWSRDFRAIYPVTTAGEGRRVLEVAAEHLGALARFFLEQPFAALGGRALPSLFDRSAIDPHEARNDARTALRTGLLCRSRRAPCSHLAVFRALAHEGAPPGDINRWMSHWLSRLAQPATPRRFFDLETAHAADPQ